MSTIPTTSAAELEFQRWMKERVSHFEWFAEKMLPQTGIGAKRLVGAMRYSLLGGGKRIRPLLCYAAGAVSGAPEEVLDRAALALEMIHSYSLVHDDMPSMDNDTLRRGRATTHVRYGEAMAMLAGDALQTEAFTVLSSPSVPPEASQRLVQTLARAAGVWGMCGGQALIEAIGHDIETAEDVKNNMENIKIYMRGHNLYDIFYGRYKKEEKDLLKKYIEIAPRDEFSDILDAADSFIYFQSKTKQKDIQNETK